MNTKGFVALLAVVLVLGGSLAGALVGGMALGKSQGSKEVSSTSSPVLPTLGSGQQQGQSTQEELQKFRQQLQGQLDQGGRLGLAGGGGLTGTIEKVEGNTLTVNTVQGTLQATIGTDTPIQMYTEGTLQDLTAGLQVMVVGQRGEDGSVAASSIVITPVGADVPFFGIFPGGRQQPSQETP